MELIWRQIKESLVQKMPSHTYRMWIEPLEVGNAGEDTLQLVCPNPYFRKRVLDYFLPEIKAEVQHITGKNIDLDLRIAAADKRPEDSVSNAPPQQLQLCLPEINIPSNYGRLLRDDYTFDQFVVGKSNDFAYSAALSLAVRKNIQQSSLFLLSKAGLGKSHLAQAVGHQILRNQPKERVYYMTAEDFANEMVSSYRSNSISAFKEKYHKLCDVLLLDDIHHLSGKNRTQIELAHTLDYLINENKKIIFSSCYAPSDIPKLSDNLRSRLTCGLISSIEPPEYRMRIKILEHYAQANSWLIPKEIFEYLASELTQDVRQLKSGMSGMIAKSSLLGRPIDLGLAKDVIRNMVQKNEDISVSTIKKLVCKYYNISIKDLVSSSRKQAIVRPRQVAMYLARRFTDQPLQSIGKSFNRYHATAMHSIGVVERGIRQGASVQKHVEYLSGKIEKGDY
ncbi:MAG: chromosomal replication initiator protein DnaA [Desulfobacteraceae bacterium]|nr:chromosomal replication initiator protein DnaA [Desulfobacteraceae bacterium]